MSKFQQIIFYTLIFTLPLNVGKHFVMPWSFSHGILVDYLIPTIYFSDILIFFLLFSYLLELTSQPRLTKKLPVAALGLFLVFLIPSVFVASNGWASVYKIARFVEFSLLAVFISHKVTYDLLKKTIPYLFAAVFFESLISIAQWFKQGFVFGYLPFGESLISSKPPFALVDFFGGLRLRSYGTFPHPNVLGGFLAISLTLLAPMLISSQRSSVRARAANVLVFLFGSLSLILTFSRSAWFVFLLGLLLVVILFRKHIGNKAFWISLVLLFSVLSSLLFSVSKTFVNDTSISVSRRLELTEASFSMFKDFPLSGVGLNNFTVRLEDYKFIAGATRFIQPVHNIYLLILSESGLLGLTGFLILISAAFRIVYLSRESLLGKVILVSLLQITFLGLFDHYLLTLEQGLLIFWILIGVVFSLESLSLPAERNFPKMKSDANEI